MTTFPLKHILIVDGYGFVFRAYHALPTLTRKDGTPVGAIFGFSSMLMKLINDFKGSHLVVVFDAGSKNFRHDLYVDYKANRPSPPDDLKAQFAGVREVATAFNVTHIEKIGFEADDIIATITRDAKQENYQVTIVSSDKDLMQLIEDDKVCMFDPIKSRKITEQEVVEKFGVPPLKLLDLLSMVGDSSDNVPGIPSIGIKTAAELIKTYGSLEELLENTHQIRQPKRRETIEKNTEQARLSKKLITLHDSVPLDYHFDDFIVDLPKADILNEYLSNQGFHSLLQKAEILFKFSNIAGKIMPIIPVNIDYQLLTTLTELDEWCNKIRKSGKMVIHPQMDLPSKSFNASPIIGMALASTAGDACYIAISNQVQASLLGPGGIPLKDVLSVLAPLLTNPAILKIGHDFKNILNLFNELGYSTSINSLDDIEIMAYLLYSGGKAYDLETLFSEQYLAQDYSDLEQNLLRDNKNNIKLPISCHDLPRCYQYFANYAHKIYSLYQLFKEQLITDKLLTIYEKIDRPLIPILYDIEKNGIKVNKVVLAKLSAEFQMRILILEESIFKVTGYQFNIASPNQLSEALFKNLSLETGKKTAKGGNFSTDAETLEELSLKGHPIADYLIEWRQLTKLKNTYTDAIPTQINPRTGRVHTHLSMTSTATGRLSSSNPNLQNIPVRSQEGNKIRTAFICEPGHKLISADYSQIELRVLCSMADVPTLKQAFLDNQDIHATTAAQVFGVKVDQVDHDMRRRAKTINFGIIYGISSFGLARQLGISAGEASEYIKAYFKQYPGIEEYMETTKEFARRHGYVTTLSGRKCITPYINDKNFNKRSFAERAAINAPIQGSSADIIKRAMILLHNQLNLQTNPGKLVLQVHDELLIEVAECSASNCTSLIKTTMEQAFKLNVPLVAAVNIGNNWAEIH